MPIQNKTMLITYSDSLGNNLKDLYENLEKYFGDAVGGVHLLPFFPSTGDRGFAPVDYDQVDPAFGDWEDVKRLGDKYYLMFDFMINHISRQSKYYKDYQEKHDQSAYKDLFLNWDKFWPENRPTQADVDLIYKRKDRAPKQAIRCAIWRPATVLSSCQRFMNTIPSNLRLPITTIMSMTSRYPW